MNPIQKKEQKKLKLKTKRNSKLRLMKQLCPFHFKEKRETFVNRNLFRFGLLKEKRPTDGQVIGYNFLKVIPN